MSRRARLLLRILRAKPYQLGPISFILDDKPTTYGVQIAYTEDAKVFFHDIAFFGRGPSDVALTAAYDRAYLAAPSGNYKVEIGPMGKLEGLRLTL